MRTPAWNPVSLDSYVASGRALEGFAAERDGAFLRIGPQDPVFRVRFLAPSDEPLGDSVLQMADPNLKFRRESRQPRLVGLRLVVLRKRPAFAVPIQEHVDGAIVEC